MVDIERAAKQATEAAQMQAGCNGTAAREKRWDECGIEEKVERLRTELQDRRPFADAAFNLARKAWRTVTRHQHQAIDGRVLVDVEDRGGDEGLLAGRSFDRLR